MQRKRDKVSQEIANLRNFEEKVKGIIDIEQSVTKAEETYKKYEKEKIENIEEINKTNVSIESLRKLRDEAKDASLQLIKVKGEINKLKDIDKRVKRTTEAHRELLDSRSELNDIRLIVNKLRQELDNERDKYKKKRISFLMNQAAILAKDLEEGQPCPVCGSTHHENIAEFTGKFPTEDELNRYEQQLRLSEDEFNKENQSLAKCVEREAQKNIECQKMILELSEMIEINFENHTIEEIIKITSFKQSEYTSKLKQSMRSESELLKQSKMFEQYDNDINKALEQLKELKTKGEQVNKNHLEASNKLTEQKTLLKKVTEEIPENLRDYDKLKAALNQNEALKEQMDREKEKAREEYEEAKDILTSLKSKLEQIEKEKNKCISTLEDAKNEFKNKCIESGFIDTDDYISSKIEEGEISSFKKRIEKHDKSLHTLKEQYKEICKKTEGLKLQEISTFQKDIDEKSEEYKILTNNKSSIEKRKENNQKVMKEIEMINLKIGEDEKRYNLIGHLARIAKGDNVARMTFERYVLAAFLEDILVAANIRLNKMTDGRYILSRTDERQRKNKQSGLELEVYDNYTGKSRHVKTLSGGESFKASLSMALGLSDVVQSYAGGVRLDTMFIDEGFGTLDPESLDNAINCLIDLQETGRLVGIISHVPELKERIDARLEVYATNTGSQTNFVI